MSREILFRAKAINRDPDREYRTNYKNGDWVYGLVTTMYDDRFPNLPAEMKNTDGVSGIDVDHRTIGEYTGLTDKNGTKIFEGDIVRIGRYFNNNFYTEDNYVCKYDTNTVSFKFYYIVPKDIADVNKYAILGDGATLSDMGCGFTIEVIGNIYDNSDLIEK
jgi:uncharacterized phage protein (TIGR01671 family)